ncbi:MAG: toxin-antitoxin system HicB family antitoxin [Gammaproteobacteria bacterium]
MMDPHAYTIAVRRAEFEGEVCFETRVKELPDVAEYADTAEEAYALAIDTIETTAAIFAEKGKAMPEPQARADDYSGRVTLRLPRSLHRALDEAAEEEGVSLNQHIVNVLSYFAGYAAGRDRSGVDAWQSEPRTVSSETRDRKVQLKVIYSNPIEPYEEAAWRKTG